MMISDIVYWTPMWLCPLASNTAWNWLFQQWMGLYYHNVYINCIWILSFYSFTGPCVKIFKEGSSKFATAIQSCCSK